MKSAIQNWTSKRTKWTEMVPYILNSKGELVVGNMKQSKLFHYVEKDFLSDKMISRLELLANNDI